MFKRIKRLLRKRNNGGFTLVEVIVASALLGVLMLGVFGFISPVLKSVKAKEQNARAVMLAETVESYIASSTKYAYYVATFSGVTQTDVTSSDPAALADIAKAKYSGTEEPFKSTAGTLEGMKDRMQKLNKENYEIRCIGMRWLTDQKAGEKKLMLTNEVVNQDNLSLDLTKSKPVFETCFYEGLYPVLRFGNYSNQYQVLKDGSTTEVVDRYEADKVTIAPGLEITMDIYLDPTCYSSSETARNNVGMTFTGTTYADYNIIKNIHLNNSGENKLLPNAELHSYNDALSAAKAADPTAAYDHPEVGETYYPDTFIYFLARKTKTTGGAGGGTPTPSSSTPPESSTPESTT